MNESRDTYVARARRAGYHGEPWVYIARQGLQKRQRAKLLAAYRQGADRKSAGWRCYCNECMRAKP